MELRVAYSLTSNRYHYVVAGFERALCGELVGPLGAGNKNRTMYLCTRCDCEARKLRAKEGD